MTRIPEPVGRAVIFVVRDFGGDMVDVEVEVDLIGSSAVARFRGTTVPVELTESEHSQACDHAEWWEDVPTPDELEIDEEADEERAEAARERAVVRSEA